MEYQKLKISPKDGNGKGKELTTLEELGKLKKANLELQARTQEKSFKLLNESVEDAIQVAIDGLKYKKDKYYQLRCAELIINHVIPIKKIKEVTGKDGNPIKIETTDKRAMVIAYVEALDGIGFEQLRQRTQDGSERIFDVDFKTEECQEGKMEEAPTDDPGGEGPGQDSGPRESVESSVPLETGPGESDFDQRAERSSIRSRCRKEY